MIALSRCLFGLLLGAAALPAQADEGPFRFVPADSTAVFKLSGPAAFAEAFAGTRLRQLLDGPTLGPLFGQANETFMQMAAVGQVPFDPEEVVEAVQAYSGDALAVVMLDKEALVDAMGAGVVPDFAVCLVFGGDGHTDLRAVAEFFELRAEEENVVLTDVTVGEHRLRVDMAPGLGSAQLSVPQVIGEDLVMLVGTDLEQQAAWFLEPQASWEPDEEFVGAQMGARVDWQAVTSMIEEGMLVGGGPDADVGLEVFELTGLMSVRSLQLTVAADESDVVGTASLGFNDQPRGLFEAIMAGGNQKRPELLAYLPPSAPAFWAGDFRFAAIYDLVQEFGLLAEATAGMNPIAEGEEMFSEMMRVRLKEDLLDHMGDQALTLVDPAAATSLFPEDELDEVSGPLAGNCAAWSLRDGRAFGASLETALRSRGLHVARKREEYQGEQINRINLLGLLDLEYVVTEDLLVLGDGSCEYSRRLLRQVLDERAARRRGEPVGELPKGVDDLLSRMPPDWSSLTAMFMPDYIQVALSVFELLQQSPFAGMGAADPDLDMIRQMLTGLATDMRAAGLEFLVSTVTETADGLVAQVRW